MMDKSQTAAPVSAGRYGHESAVSGAAHHSRTGPDPRALLIAFHFPPQAASSGIQRTLSFAKCLPRHGWTPIVLSAAPIAYDRKNSSQLQDIPADIIVRRAFALDSK